MVDISDISRYVKIQGEMPRLQANYNRYLRELKRAAKSLAKMDPERILAAIKISQKENSGLTIYNCSNEYIGRYTDGCNQYWSSLYNSWHAMSGPSQFGSVIEELYPDNFEKFETSILLDITPISAFLPACPTTTRLTKIQNDEYSGKIWGTCGNNKRRSTTGVSNVYSSGLGSALPKQRTYINNACMGAQLPIK